MADRSSGAVPLHPAWHALASRSSVAVGALVALISLLEHTPAWVASLRGLIAFVLVRWAARTGLSVLEQALSADAERNDREGVEK